MGTNHNAIPSQPIFIQLPNSSAIEMCNRFAFNTSTITEYMTNGSNRPLLFFLRKTRNDEYLVVMPEAIKNKGMWKAKINRPKAVGMAECPITIRIIVMPLAISNHCNLCLFASIGIFLSFGTTLQTNDYIFYD